jgi:iron-sulfur cluster repair protein YtfE (RIC family)
MKDPGLDFLMGKMEETGLMPSNIKKYTDIDNDIMVVEQMIKNKKTKGRKLNASGGRVPRSGGGIMKIIQNFFKKKPETLKEFIEKRKFLEKITGNTKEAQLQKMLEEQKILQKQLEKNPPFKFPDTGPHSDISKEIEVILNKKTTKHADGGLAGMLGE